MSIRIAGQVIASAGSLTSHNEDPNAHADIRELISQGGGSSEAKWGAITGDINAQTDLTAAIAEKQDKLTAGEGITIEGNVISAIGGGGGSAELPDNVYTEDNLVAGENITFSEVLPEGGIDEHTLACFHLDTDGVDVVTGQNIYPGFTADTNVRKFGSASAMWSNSISMPFSVNSYEDFSFDYWVFVPNASRNSTRLGFQKNGFDIGTVLFNSDGGITFGLFGGYPTSTKVEFSIWTHIYVYYKAEDRSFHLFVNGKEVFSIQNEESNVFSDVKQFVNDGYTVSRFDEIRISDCIRWTKDFTPPTEPYTLATGPSKKAINAVIPEVELPDTVYTQDNLVAGDNIKIKEVVNPNVIDDNTLLCWHFDGDTKDVVQGAEIQLYPGYASLNTSYYKFGSGSCPDYLNPGKYISLGTTITDNDNFTIDFWTRALKDYDTFSWQCSLMGTTSVNFYAFGGNNLLFQAIDPYYGTEVASIQKTNTIDASNWSHWAFTYNKDTREVAVYANGEKQGSVILPTSFTFSFDTFSPLATNYNQGLIDELRVTKSLAWEKDFTPPTEAYTKGEGGVKKSINAIIPEGIYTQSNLLGGKDIEIIPEPVDGGVDEYTTGMWHFDSSMSDEINGKGFSYDRVGTYIDGKFGKGVYSVYGGRTDSEILCETQSIEKDFTIDCVVLPKDTSSSGTVLYLYAGDQSGDYYGLSVTYSMIGGSVSLGHRSAVLTSKTLTPLTAADKPHLALQRRGNFVEVFIEGKKEIEYDISSIATELTGKGFGVNSATWVGIDELRISNIARYAEDFTPPMLPYSKAEPTGRYVISFTGETGEAGGEGESDVDLASTGFASNCILSAPNGLLTAGTESHWYDSWKTLSSSEKADRRNVKIAASGRNSKQTFTLTQLNGNWDLIVKIKLTAMSSGTFRPNDDSVISLYMPRTAGSTSGSQMLRLGFKNTSGASETKPFYCNIFPTSSSDTENYRIVSSVIPTKDTWYWVKLNKTGTTFTYSYSTNGTTYTTLGTVNNVPAFTSENEEGGYLKIDVCTNTYAHYDLSSNEFNNIFFGTEKTPLVTYVDGFAGPIVAKSGMSVLLPDGIEATSGRLASVGLTLPEDVSLTPANEGSYYVCLLSDSTLINIQKNQYFVRETSPGYEAGRLWYQPSTNTMKGTSATTYLAKENSILLGEYTYSNGLITAFSAYSPLKITDISNAGNQIDYVIERYEDEEGNWYEVWRSRKLRQGGLVVSNGASGVQTVTFLKPFAKKPHLTGGSVSSDTGSSTNQGAAILHSSASLTTTGFSTYVAPAIKKYWTAEGQGA